jgi:hypothetical protein
LSTSFHAPFRPHISIPYIMYSDSLRAGCSGYRIPLRA